MKAPGTISLQSCLCVEPPDERYSFWKWKWNHCEKSFDHLLSDFIKSYVMSHENGNWKLLERKSAFFLLPFSLYLLISVQDCKRKIIFCPPHPHIKEACHPTHLWKSVTSILATKKPFNPSLLQRRSGLHLFNAQLFFTKNLLTIDSRNKLNYFISLRPSPPSLCENFTNV